MEIAFSPLTVVGAIATVVATVVIVRQVLKALRPR